MKLYQTQFALVSLILVTSIGFCQQPSKAPKREKTWIYDVNIIKDEAGNTVKVEKVVFGKGTPGGSVIIRYFETKERRDAGGNVIYSTRERLGENNVDPEIVKQYGGESGNSNQQQN